MLLTVPCPPMSRKYVCLGFTFYPALEISPLGFPSPAPLSTTNGVPVAPLTAPLLIPTCKTPHKPPILQGGFLAIGSLAQKNPSNSPCFYTLQSEEEAQVSDVKSTGNRLGRREEAERGWWGHLWDWIKGGRVDTLPLHRRAWAVAPAVTGQQ